MSPAGRWSKKPRPLGKPEDALTWTLLYGREKVSQMKDRKAPQSGSTRTAPTSETWNSVPWKKLEQHCFRIQKRIYRASQRGNQRAVHKLQKLLMKSEAARLLAVRRVTQENQGKKTAGVDGVKSVRPKERLLMARHIHPTYWKHIKAQPVRRVWIPKPGKSEKRPLGIPTVFERARQCLAKLALEPEWEARFEPNSYGFRPARSAQDAIGAIFNGIRFKAKYVLDADLKACFDHINQEALLNKLHTYTVMKQTIKGWLKAGVLENGVFAPTETIIWGWSNYYRTVASSDIFSSCDRHVWFQLQSWARRRHSRKKRSWIDAKYWKQVDGRDTFCTPMGAKLRLHRDTAIQRHTKVRGTTSPYDGNLLYWSQRLKTHPLMHARRAKLLQKQQGKCRWCGLTFRDEDILEIDHIDHNHRNDTLSNLLLLHLHCHDERHSKLTETVMELKATRKHKRKPEGTLPEGSSQEQWDAEIAVTKERLRKLEQEGISLK